MRGILGTDSNYQREMTILNRHIKITEEGLEYEADPKHAKILIEAMGFTTESKSVVGPCLRDSADGEVAEEPLDKAEASSYRQLVARANYMS
ncbi:hypothetical protein N9L68_00950 [bacterium]|nr:hypothetical protein [bacterium]